MKSKFTKLQIKAIEESGKNILVSASAGSGKTTVLIERIINKIKVQLWNVDEMLIVTYTEAAANEMKQRLRSRLNRELMTDPGNRHIRKQLTLLSNASISTFHSFCNSVIQKFFYLIDMDAKYKISDDIETVLLEDETLEALFNDLFEQNDEAFMKLVHRFTTNSDESLKLFISDLYKKLRALPFPNVFIEKALSYYDFEDLTDFTFYPTIIKRVNEILNEAEKQFKIARDLATPIGHSYQELYNEDMLIVESVRSSLSDYDACRTVINNMTFQTFRAKCKSDDEETKERIKEHRDTGKSLMNDMTKKYFNYSAGLCGNLIKGNKEIVEALVDVVKLYNERLREVKKEKGLVDFSDLEEMTLKIFALEGFNNEATRFYKAQFKEILIDEYQDTNEFQTSIINSISNQKNIFMVGDVKQSIYRFRGSEPSIFQEKYKTYSTNDLEGLLINLNTNYRSRKDVLDYINFICKQLMDEELFEIEYDELASLNFGQNSYNALDECLIKVAIIDQSKFKEQDVSLNKREIEAHYCAETIQNLVKSGKKVSTKEGEREITYKDIVILSRTKHEQEVYNDVFKHYNIPFLASDVSGYFNSIEVLTVISFLKVIDNPLQDIPLIATLRSSMFDINECDLVEIKVNSRKEYFYEKLIDYKIVGKDETLQKKISYFDQLLSTYRERVKNEALSEIIYSIYHETNYYDFVLGQSGGVQRQANLDLLFEKAKEYEHLTSNSLFKFINLINFLTEKDKDINQARTVSDNEDLVQFMSIHKSKGLEFPVVFITNLGKEYNTQDEKSTILFDKDLGVTLSYMDLERRVKYDTIYQNLIKDKMHKQMMAEELRLLYVAMTRARERLYLVGTVKDFEKEKKKLDELSQLEEVLLPSKERICTNYFSLILKAMSRHSAMQKLLGTNHSFDLNEPICEIEVINQLEFAYVSNEELKSFELDFSKYTHLFSERLNFVYPHKDKTTHFSKQTISDIKRSSRINEMTNTIGKVMLSTPRFIKDETRNATLRGTSFHLFMQHIDYKKQYDMDHLKELRSRLVVKEILTEEEAMLVDLNKIVSFLNSDLAQTIKESKHIYQELPFTTLVDSKLVYQEDMGEIDILVQGVMDLFVVFDEEAYLIDFKSDRINDTESEINKLKKEYQIQINVYKEAMKRIYQDKNIKAFLYLFAINKYIEM